MDIKLAHKIKGELDRLEKDRAFLLKTMGLIISMYGIPDPKAATKVVKGGENGQA